jgi:hypothetical protein
VPGARSSTDIVSITGLREKSEKAYGPPKPGQRVFELLALTAKAIRLNGERSEVRGSLRDLRLKPERDCEPFPPHVEAG